MSDELSRSATRVAGFDDAELDFQLLRQLGVANYGGGTVGEALEGADGHCQVGNLPLFDAVLFDWLDETLAA